MSTFFALNPGHIPDFTTFTEVTSGRSPIQGYESLGNLQSALKDVTQAVVILSGTANDVKATVPKLKAFQPFVTVLAVLSPDAITTDLGPDVDVITTPVNAAELTARLKTLSRLSELMGAMVHSAQFDDVTQLHNGRYFINRLNAEISLAKRHMSPLSCIVLDISFYQVYLDAYGYDFVNDLLKHLALIVESHKRHEDIVARVGDHEIGILLTRSTEKGARIMARRIIDQIESVPFVRDEASEPLTVVAGIVSFPIPNEDQQQTDANMMLRYARHATHQAKEADADGIQLFSDITPSL